MWSAQNRCRKEPTDGVAWSATLAEVRAPRHIGGPVEGPPLNPSICSTTAMFEGFQRGGSHEIFATLSEILTPGFLVEVPHRSLETA